MKLTDFGYQLNIPKMPTMRGTDPLWCQSQSMTQRHMTQVKELNEVINMATLREVAQNYEQKTTRNIAELKSVPVDMDIEEKTFTKQDGEEFSMKLAEIDGEQYRVPESVVQGLNSILSEKPDLTHFKVVKSGEGMNTKYTVVAL